MQRVPEATPHTVRHNQAAAAALALDPHDFELAERGRLCDPVTKIENGWGAATWNIAEYGFLDDPEPPPTVHPSLWRQARLNTSAGLFEVCDGIYQVRGHDLSNITFVRGETGWLVIDPLSSAETAATALALANEHLGERPVVAVLYTHSHVDHFAGVRGVIDEAHVVAGRVAVIAPEGFLHAAVSENVYAGTAMFRRAMYMYGPLLERSATGQVDAGLGKAVPILGSPGLIAPTDSITRTGETRRIDGIDVEFQLTPDTEAPAEMNFYFPQFSALCMAENCCGTMHNLYTPRGAQVRDALAWSTYIDEAIVLFSERSDTVFASHHWPRWGMDEGRRFMELQRDLYRYLHDQTLRLANRGLVPTEIAAAVDLPEPFASEASTRGYYGTVSHNVKAVYQRYLGWFDGNPAHLDPLPPAEAGQRYVTYMGGADQLVEKARQSYDEGDYRFVAEVLAHVVFSEPDHQDARALQADALEQLGFQSESAPWRNFYLQGAKELREGILDFGPASLANPDVTRAMTLGMLLDFVGIRLDADRFGVTTVAISFAAGEDVRTLWVQNRAVHHRRGRAEGATCHVAGDIAALAALCTGVASPEGAAPTEGLEIDGDRAALDAIWTCLDQFRVGFGVVTP